jgi:flavin-dependent dehydrogenase
MSYHRSILPGCAWLFPLGQNEYNVGCCMRSRDAMRRRIRLQRTFRDFLRQFPPARRLMDRAVDVTPFRGGVLRTGFEGAAPYRESTGLLAVGEAIGTTLPLSGEGVGKAMESGETAADVIHDALGSGSLTPLRVFSERLRERMRPRYRSYEAAERWITTPWLNDLTAITTPWLNDLTAMALRRNARLRDGLAGVLRETVDPRAVFSLLGLLRSVRQ